MLEQQDYSEPIELETEVTAPITPIGNELPINAQAINQQALLDHIVEATEAAQEWLDSIEMRPTQVFDPLMASVFAMPILSAYLALSSGARWSAYFPWMWIMQMAISTMIPAVIVMRINRMRRENREDQLASQADVLWIPRLIHSFDSPNTARRTAARRVLSRLLLRLKPSNSQMLVATQQTDLIYTLRMNRPRDMDLNITIIKALEQVGDDSGLAAIDCVANRNVWLPSKRFVQQTARISLVRMKARLEQSVDRSSDAVRIAPLHAQTSALQLKTRESVPEVDALKKRLEDEQRGRSSPGMRRPFLVLAWTAILPGSLWLTIASMADKDYLFAAIYGGMFALTTQLPRYVLSQEQAVAAQCLAAFNNVQGVGPLAEALEWPDPAIKITAAKSLTHLLPLLNASDSGLLTSRQRGCLHRVLRMGNARKQEPLILAILTALEQVGDEVALPHVKQLAHGHARSNAQLRIAARARECLPFLEAGATQRQGSQTLLRASSIEASQPDVLLRSASLAGVTEPVQLLRAGVERE